VKDQDLRNVLAMMLFRGDDIDKPMGLLSGGERARVALVQLLLDKPNVLILDEPTNHLDIASREALEGALASFAGTILCVSHDRYFLDKSVSRLLILTPPNIRDFEGNYSKWMARQREEARQASVGESRSAPSRARTPAASSKAPAPAAPKGARGGSDNPYLRPFGRLGLKELERQITDTEVLLAECQEGFSAGGKLNNPREAKRRQAEYETLSKKLQQLEAEYYAREQ
jgi:ATP-binding cassette subfamily F protein 3